MTNLKIHVQSPQGDCYTTAGLPKCLVEMVGEEKLRDAIQGAYVSLGMEVTSIQRIEEIAYEL